jgi:hypothetical protein
MKNIILVIASAGLLLFGYQSSAQVLLATTNKGELVEIDLVAGTANLIGDAGLLDGKPTDTGWTGLSFDAAGNLFAVSRHSGEPETGCPGSPLTTQNTCAHLYRIDPDNGAVLAEIGITETPYLSDIDFAAFGGALYGNQWDSRGALIMLNTATGTANIIDHFGTKFDGMGNAINLQNGGLSVNPVSGAIWAVENAFGNSEGGIPSVFKVDATTGKVIGPEVPLGLMGSPLPFGLDSLEILPDGRFIATRGGGRSDVYEINPVPDATSGLAEVTLIPLMLDPAITGSLNGLEFLKASPGPIDNLIDDIIDLGLDDRTTRRLIRILESAQRLLDKGLLSKARGRMYDFVVELEFTVARNKIEIVDANQLLKDASNILGQIEFQ